MKFKSRSRLKGTVPYNFDKEGGNKMYSRPELLELGSAAVLIQGCKCGKPEINPEEERQLDDDVED